MIEKVLRGFAQPVRVETLKIKVDPISPGARTYPKTNVPARLHVDPPHGQLLTPHLQIMVCIRPANDGGHSLFLDTWGLLDAIERNDALLYRDLFEMPRRIAFPPQEPVCGPTIAFRRGNLLCLHGGGRPADHVGTRFSEWLDRSMHDGNGIRVLAEAGDVLVINNHRMLHGRDGFGDLRREFERALIWLAEPHRAPVKFVEHAAAIAARLDCALTSEPGWVRRAFGFQPPSESGFPDEPDRSEELGAVLDRLLNDQRPPATET